MIFLFFLFTIDPRYHTFDEVALELDSIARHYPQITRLDTLGYSTLESLPVFALKISDNVDADEDEPEILYVACHHAEEILGIEICMYMINDLVTNYMDDPTITYWIDNREIWFVPLLNPEGHGVVMQGLDTTWRKNKRDNNNNGTFDLNYDGVDLNRNYKFYWENGGSSDPSSEYYRGPAPFSEKEIQGFSNFCMSHHFSFCITYHSARTGIGEVVYYPWRVGTYTSPDFSFIRTIAAELSSLIINDQGTGHYMAMTGIGVDGRARNWLYGVCNAFTYCVEVSTTTIQPGWMVDDICERNKVGAYYLLDRVEGHAITGCIYDSLTGKPLSAEVIIEDYYDPTLPERMSDPEYGRYLRMDTGGVFNIEIRCEGYETKLLNDVIVSGGVPTVIDVYLNPMEGSMPLQKKSDDFVVHPNPSRSIFTIEMPDPNDLRSLRIYDRTGRLVKTFDLPPPQLLTWAGDDDMNREVANGVYFIVGERHVAAQDIQENTTQKRFVQKMVILR
jgi:carboxypeptidase T